MRRPSPVVERPEKMMWPDCSPPRAAFGGEHLLEDVLVADGGAKHLDAGALERGFEAHVGHGGGDDGGVGEKAAGLEVARGEEEDGVAVDDAAVLVGEEGAVGVAVEGDAERGFVVTDGAGDDLGVERAAVLVDVAAVGRGVGDDDVGAAELREELGGDGGGGSVGAVDDDAAVVEGEAGDGGEEEADVVGAVGFVDLGSGRVIRCGFADCRLETTRCLKISSSMASSVASGSL